MIQSRTCRECLAEFQGGPRAYYCHSCRKVRQLQQGAASKARERAGLTRKIGSEDTCELCKDKYIVKGGLQRFCEKCQPVHALEYDRETSLPFYHENKERINPVRYERRHVGNRPCDLCRKEYKQTDKSLTCSDKCKRLLKNKKWNEWSKSKETKKSP